MSVHPAETPEMAKAKKQAYMPHYRRQGTSSSWYFLTGEPDQTRQLASSVGFRFRWLPDEYRIDHPPTLLESFSLVLFGLAFFLVGNLQGVVEGRDLLG